MRDLARALSNIKLYHYDERFQLGLVYEAIERAINAEAEVERLRLMVKSITGGLDECMETVHFLEAENAKLRKVVDAAKEWINCPCEDMRECLECTAFKFRNALAELDKEGER